MAPPQRWQRRQVARHDTEVFVANTKSAIKRVRQNARRVAINAPRRTAAKTYVAKALRTANGAQPDESAAALAEAMAALDRAAKAGAIHPNAAARRKSRLARKVNAVLGGGQLQASKVRATGKATAAKAARARVTASKGRTAAGPKTAAGKARVALAKTTGGTKAAGSAANTEQAAKRATTGSGTAKTASRKSAAKRQG